MRHLGSGLRGRLLLSVIGAIAAVLAALTVGFDLVLADRLNHDANGVVQARASAELASLRISLGRIVLPEAPDDLSPDLQIWVFQGVRLLEQPRTSPINDRAAAALARRAPGTEDVSRTSTRLYAVPVVQSARRLGVVVAGVSLAPYKQTQRTALVASAILALSVLLAVWFAARWLIGRALRPVARMTRQASEWSEHDLDRRFELGEPTDELTQLGSTLDALLERLGASLRHEQRLSAEISHELRTPLANIVAEAQYALRHGLQTGEGRATLEHILQSARTLGRTLDTLMATARAQLDPRAGSSDAVACARAAVKASLGSRAEASLGSRADQAPLHGRSDLEVAVNAPAGPIRVGAERDLVERILGPLLDNAARHAHRVVAVGVEVDGDRVRFTVRDDGPGVPAAEQEAIFEPGHQAERVADPSGRTADAPSGAPSATAALAASGAGLGLALSRRLARSAGGDVTFEPGDVGAQFVVVLPGG